MKAKILLYALLPLIATSIHLAEAQQPKKNARIGFLSVGSASSVYPEGIKAFRQGLRDLGYVEGQNLFIDWRFAEGKREVLPTSQATWCTSRSMSLLPRVHRGQTLPSVRPAPSPSLWHTAPILSVPGSWLASLIPAGT